MPFIGLPKKYNTGALGGHAVSDGLVVAPLEVLETSVLLDEGHFDGPGGPVSLLSDDELRDPPVVGSGVVLFLAIDEDHDVRVLLERTRLPQIRELRLVPAAGLGGAGELRERDDRDVELLRQPLQSPAYAPDLLGAVLEPAPALHELKVVDDEKVEPGLELEPARLGAHFHHRDAGRVVDEYLCLGEIGDSLNQLRPVPLGEKPRTELVHIHPGLAAEHAEDELLFRHREAKDPDPPADPEPHVLRDVHAEAGFSHRRPGGHDDEVRALQARCDLVELHEAGRDPGDQLLLLGELVDVLEGLLDDFRDGLEAAPDRPFGDLENRLLGLVEHHLGLLDLAEAGLTDAVGGGDEVAENRFVLDDPRVVRNVRRPGDAFQKRAQVGDAADGLEVARSRELFPEGYEVDGVAASGERSHAKKDSSMSVAVEVPLSKDL